MKRIIFCLACVCLSGVAYTQEKGVEFEQIQTWEQVKARAKAENKYIFVDVFATWCEPCKFMDDSVYKSGKVGALMNDKFVSVKVQIDSTKGDNQMTANWRRYAKQFERDYNINAYPTCLFFDPNGKVVHKFSGAAVDTNFIKVVKDALDLNRQYYTLLEAYRNKQLIYAQMPALIKAAKNRNDIADAEKIAEDYINNYLFKLNEEELFTKDNLILIGRYLGDYQSKSYLFYKIQTDKINSVLGMNKAQYSIKKLINQRYMPKSDTWKTTRPNWDILMKNTVSKFGLLGQEAVFGNMMNYYLELQDWANFGKYYVRYFERALKRPEYNVNDMSWYGVFEHVNDPKVLSFACDVVMKYAMGEWYQSDWRAYDTYANLLYKTGKKDQAIAWEEKAAELSNNNKEIIENLEKMKNNQATWQEQAKN